MNFDDEEEEVELYTSIRERQAYEDQATLYAIILATEHLERAFARDAITNEEYTKECNKLITQFKMAEKAAIKDDMTTETFMSLYQMDVSFVFFVFVIVLWSAGQFFFSLK